MTRSGETMGATMGATHVQSSILQDFTIDFTKPLHGEVSNERPICCACAVHFEVGYCDKWRSWCAQSLQFPVPSVLYTYLGTCGVSLVSFQMSADS